MVYASRRRTCAPESYDAAVILPASSCSTNSCSMRTALAALISKLYRLYCCNCWGTKFKLEVCWNPLLWLENMSLGWNIEQPHWFIKSGADLTRAWLFDF